MVSCLLLAVGLKGHAESINIDFNTNRADAVHAVANGVYSRGGTVWNSVVSTNPKLPRLVTEYGRTTTVGFATSVAAVPGFRSGFTNTLQDTGITKVSGRGGVDYYFAVTNLQASLQWDLAVYLANTGLGITVQGWNSKTNLIVPTGQLPGDEGADYLLFTNLDVSVYPGGPGQLVVYPIWGASNALVAGVQVRPSPVQVPAAATRYVAPGGGHTYPYDSWANAATSLQAAIAEPLNLHEVILVSNGVYSGEGSNGAVCYVGSDYPDVTYTLRSVNGPEYTIVDGSGSRRCLYVGSNSLVEGFTLRNGFIGGYGYTIGGAAGAGAYIEAGELSRCIVVSNSAVGSWAMIYMEPGGDASGGGVYVVQGAVRNCVVAHNHCTGGDGYPGGMSPMPPYDFYPPTPGGSAYGGGIYLISGSAQNCSVALNTVTPGFGSMISGTAAGSGLYGGSIVSTIIHGNTPSSNQISGATATYSCCPLLTNGTGNITNNPSFRPDTDYLLAADSPCRDLGENDFWTEFGTDVHAVPRQLGGRVDMGAAEFWEMSASPRNTGGIFELRWHVITGRTYAVQSTTNLLSDTWLDAIPSTNPAGSMIVLPEPLSQGRKTYRLLMQTGE